MDYLNLKKGRLVGAMTSNHKLIVGDYVHWKGGWGSDPEEEVLVTGIQVNFEPGDKEGYEVKELDWNCIIGREVIIDLDNGHWAWAFQISRIEYSN